MSETSAHKSTTQGPLRHRKFAHQMVRVEVEASGAHLLQMLSLGPRLHA